MTMVIGMGVLAEDKQFRLDWVKWIIVFALLAGAVYANWYYSAESVLYRVIGFLAAVGVSALIASQTAKGAATIELAIGARTEWRKVVWPTKQERNQTTLVVLVIIMLMAVILWIIDSLLSLAASGIMG
jgi:preprotein translocase subunit SecE